MLTFRGQVCENEKDFWWWVVADMWLKSHVKFIRWMTPLICALGLNMTGIQAKIWQLDVASSIPRVTRVMAFPVNMTWISLSWLGDSDILLSLCKIYFPKHSLHEQDSCQTHTVALIHGTIPAWIHGLSMEAWQYKSTWYSPMVYIFERSKELANSSLWVVPN